jgi:hypothetical protein
MGVVLAAIRAGRTLLPLLLISVGSWVNPRPSGSSHGTQPDAVAQLAVMVQHDALQRSDLLRLFIC